MSLFKRGSTWWVCFTTPAGERIRCSAQTTDRTQAQQFHDQLKAESWRIQKLGDKPQHTWDDAAYQWLMEKQHKKSYDGDVSKIRWLQHYLRGLELTMISRELIVQIGAIKAQEASPATANRHLALIRSILRRARDEWEWIEHIPKIRLYREAKRRVRWLTPEQVHRLLDELMPHQRELTLFALATGLRQSNVQHLRWDQVDLDRGTMWIYGDQAKGNDDIHVSLSSFAIEILQRQKGWHKDVVFTRKGHPITEVNTKSWRKALGRAGIENFRWHDLRHTWASWLVQNGTPLYALQEMGGWKSSDMVRRYAHLAPPHLAPHAEVVGKMLSAVADTNLAQLSHSAQPNEAVSGD